MKVELSQMEARVIGCLIEKQITTPDQYPLSLNALVNACNQKSNRDPIMDVDEATVQSTLDGLTKKHLILERSGFGSRVQKYQHRFCNTEYGTLKFTPQELAIVCELLLRGPQTPGELRSRVGRMAPLQDGGQVDTALENLATRPDGPFVKQLPRESGRRDSRFAHLFSGEDQADSMIESGQGPFDTVGQRRDFSRPALTPGEASPLAETEPRPNIGDSEARGSLAARVQSLEEQVAVLRQEVETLRGSIK